MKNYESPCLYCDEFAPDTLIASGGTLNGNPKAHSQCPNSPFIGDEPAVPSKK